ncbi:KRAB-A domain-containing protein 2-like [Pectinophora gossypiella]|nr:KRAB-A domain-containing protein 2-like [Pectinophora gossypiella]
MNEVKRKNVGTTGLNNHEEANNIFKRNFEQKLLDYDETHQGSMRKPWFQKRVVEVIQQLKKAKALNPGERRAQMDYYYTAKYDVLTTEDKDHLIFRRYDSEEPTVYIIPREQYFNKLSEVHESCGHAGRDKMIHIIKNKFYIPKKAIEIFVSLCPTCRMYRNAPKRSSIMNPANVRYNAKGQFDIIDLQYCADGDYKWLLSYQDNATKFTLLRPLKTKNISDVAMELVNIFTTFGSPNVLQSEMGHDLTEKVIKEITALWPASNIVQGCGPNPRKPQGRTESQDIENLLQSWMHEKNSTNWTLGCMFVQYQKNNTLHPLTGKSSYQALFGCEPNIPLNLPCVIVSVKSEQNLDNDSVPISPIEVPIEFDSGCSTTVLKPESKYLPPENVEYDKVFLTNIKIETTDPEEHSDEEKFDINEIHKGVKRKKC